MIDPRFYEPLGPLRLADLAARCGGELASPDAADIQISTVASIAEGGEGAIAFVRDDKRLPALAESGVAACFLLSDQVERARDSGVALVAAPRPQESFARACDALMRPRSDAAFPTAHDGRLIAPDAEIDADARIAAGAVVGAGAKIGPRTVIGPNAVIGAGVEIGADCRIGPGAIIIFALLGDRVFIAANAVIGERGFGVTAGGQGAVDMPHLGRVVIADEVSIGAGSAVDRGMLTDTVIGAQTKIDNLVQIAHNVTVGKSCIIAGCTGVSGSVVIEDHVVLGGGVGLADHVRIGAGAQLAGATLVMRDVPGGEIWSGAPARPIKQFFRETAALTRLARGPRRKNDA